MDRWIKYLIVIRLTSSNFGAGFATKKAEENTKCNKELQVAP